MTQRRIALSAGMAWALAPLVLPACASQPVGPMKALTADDFRGARQRGLGLGTLSNGNRSPADHDAAQELGATHVRAFIEAERMGNSDTYAVPSAQLQALEQMLLNLEQRGIYLVLAAGFGADARDGREGNDTLWRNPRRAASAVALWQQLARQLRGRNVVAAFDIVNEPVPHGLTYALRQERWLELAARVIDGVRAVDPQRVLVIESAPDATPESFGHLRPLPYTGLVYSLHSYHPFSFTHQRVMKEYPQPRAYPEREPDGRSSDELLAQSLDEVVKFAQRYDRPIYVGEFSAPRWAPGGSTARYIADSIALFNRHGFSWAYHEFRAWHGWDPEIASPLPQMRQRRGEAPVVSALRTGLRAPR